MLTRCYSKSAQQRRQTYIGCSVDKKWHRFSVFREWVVSQEYINMHLDKDLMVKGNKVYSENTCILVSNAVNNLMASHTKRRGKFPIGVSFDSSREKFMAHIAIDGKSVGLGRFDTVDEAASKYATAKSENITRIAKEQKCKKTKHALDVIAKSVLKGEYFE